MDKREQMLAEGKISGLILKYSLPAILSGLISAIYNIVDQIFIGQQVGVIGNSATNVVFPVVMITSALATLIGVGTSSNFSLARGRKDEDLSKKFIGNGILMAVVWGVTICVIALLFSSQILNVSGATPANMEYAQTYLGILALGFPFFVFSTSVSHIIRADGSPKYSMICIGSGAILNIVLDALFMYGFNMGIAGAAWATVIGQVVSAGLSVKYLTKFKTFKLDKSVISLKFFAMKKIALLGIAPFVNQISISITQIAMNNTITLYGADSIYGTDIPLACVGIITKVNMIFVTIAIGIGQGSQPIIGFNYGAKNYTRVMEAIRKNLMYVSVVSVMAFCAFQIFPRQITSLFGDGSELYFEFAESYFRIFMFMAFTIGIQPVAGNFFTSLGKSTRGVFISLTKQILFLLPLIIILPMFMGLDGVLYAGPIADTAAVLVSSILLIKEYRNLKRLDNEQNAVKKLTEREILC